MPDSVRTEPHSIPSPPERRSKHSLRIESTHFWATLSSVALAGCGVIGVRSVFLGHTRLRVRVIRYGPREL